MKRYLWLILLGFLLLGYAPLETLSAPPPVASSTGGSSIARSDGAELLYAPVPPASAQNPAFSPDGGRLVFTLFDNGYNSGPVGLFLFELAISQTTRLTPVEDQDNVNLPGAAWNGFSSMILRTAC